MKYRAFIASTLLAVGLGVPIARGQVRHLPSTAQGGIVAATDRNLREGQVEAGKPGASTKSYAKPSDAELKSRLTKIQYDVTQREATETPFQNDYWNNSEEGIYVDVVSGEPLFSSREMFKSGTGWPSFFRPLVAEHIVEKVDRRLRVPRTEVRSLYADSHLGHVFNDGPHPTGLRYCINSAALRFVPVDRLQAEGYGEFLARFEQAAKR